MARRKMAFTEDFNSFSAISLRKLLQQRDILVLAVLSIFFYLCFYNTIVNMNAYFEL